jgi:hypothetical protein
MMGGLVECCTSGRRLAEGGYTQTLKRSTDMEDTNNIPNEEQTSRLQQPAVMGSTPRQRWEKLKRHILEETAQIDKDTPWQEQEPEWWLEMQTIERNVRQYCP